MQHRLLSFFKATLQHGCAFSITLQHRFILPLLRPLMIQPTLTPHIHLATQVHSLSHLATQITLFFTATLQHGCALSTTLQHRCIFSLLRPPTMQPTATLQHRGALSVTLEYNPSLSLQPPYHPATRVRVLKRLGTQPTLILHSHSATRARFLKHLATQIALVLHKHPATKPTDPSDSFVSHLETQMHLLSHPAMQTLPILFLDASRPGRLGSFSFPSVRPNTMPYFSVSTPPPLSRRPASTLVPHQ